MSEHLLRFEVNGQPREVSVEANQLLIDLLRERLGLSGTKEACSIGVCGVCSVLVDGRVVSACLMPAVMVDGCRVQTVEGLAGPDGQLTPLQEAFIRHGGFQCGICTPGQLMAATALLAEQPHPTVEQIKEWMMGNLCRCTGYYKIIDSILAAAEMSS